MRLLLIALPLALIPQTAALAATARPKLLVTIVIDQFRADYLMRFEKRFLPAKLKGGDVGGFEYLTTRGAYFPWGQYDILQSMTGPGHATVLTGSYPYQAGIPINTWYDEKTHSPVYCTEDPKAPTIGVATQEPHSGNSPRNLIATTVGDELKNAGYPSRVVSVSLKDRAAILMGGHRADLALWYDSGAGTWVSSRYYLPDGKLPDWVMAMNQELKAHQNDKIEWNPEGPGTGYSSSEDVGSRPFPHVATRGSKAALGTPYGNELTVEAAEKAIDAYRLGRGKATDLFAVSFSSHDYVGHEFGPNSREQEEMTVSEDRSVSKLLNFIRRKVPGGLENVDIVLTGDHGMAPHPRLARLWGIDSGQIDERALARQVSEELNKKYGKPDQGDWIEHVIEFNFYLNRKAAADKKVGLGELEAEVKRRLTGVPGVAWVFTSQEYFQRKLPPGMAERQVNHTYFPGRSGDVMIIPRPFYTITGDPVTHMTGYSYDRTVPIVIAGFHVKPGTYSSRAEVVDIAPTLSFLSGTIAPALSEGRVLSEIFR